MAEQNWSKEPWYHHNDPCNISGQDHAKRIIGSLGFISYVDDYTTARANALRIVACVNACAGIPSAALEAGVIGELLEVCRSLHKSNIDWDCDCPLEHDEYDHEVQCLAYLFQSALAKLQQPEEG